MADQFKKDILTESESDLPFSEAKSAPPSSETSDAASASAGVTALDDSANESNVLPPDDNDLIAKENAIPPLKKQNIWGKLLFLLINFAVVGAILGIEYSNSGRLPSFAELAAGVRGNEWYLFGAFMMFVSFVVCESLCFMMILHSTGNGWKPFTSVKITIIGKYYDHITPFSMGGQPFQMYYLNRRGVDIATSCAAPLARHSIKLLAVNIFVITLYIVNPTDASLGIKIAAFIGVAFNLTMPVFALILILKKEVGLAIARWVVKLGAKIKIVKDYDRTLKKITTETEKFLNSLRFLGSRPLLLIGVGIFSALEVVSLVCVPFFVVRAFGVPIEFFDALVKGFYNMNAASFIPTPGTAGGAEAFFYGLFGDTLPEGSFFWAVMIWRFITFYSFILIGTATNIAMFISSWRKTKAYNREIIAKRLRIRQLIEERAARRRSSAPSQTPAPPESDPADDFSDR